MTDRPAHHDETLPSLDNKVVVVTGASAGIGAAAAVALDRLGAQVAVVGRSPSKTEAVAAQAHARPFVCDFASLDEVRRLAGELAGAYPHIDVLANNAGLALRRGATSADGHELTFQVNHLAPFLLTNLLADQLSGGGTVITTSSRMHLIGRVERDNLERVGTHPQLLYGTSKLENVLFTRELARRWRDRQVAAAAFHPGTVRTEFGRRGGLLIDLVYRSPLRYVVLVSPKEGADTLVWLASTTPGTDWQSGGYYHHRRPARTSPQARDDELAAWLWERSAELVGLG